MLPGRLQQFEGHVHDGALHLFVPGLTERISQREVGKKETGHPALFNDIPRGTDHHGGNLIFFEMPGYQTHGLVTDRSKGGKNYGIDAILPAEL